jgi:hypothetical protein
MDVVEIKKFSSYQGPWLLMGWVVKLRPRPLYFRERIPVPI